MARMSAHLRRAVTIALLLSLPSVGCYATHHKRLESNPSLDDATGITTRSGEEILFAKHAARIVDDTLFAIGTVGPVKVPTDSVATVTSHGFSPWGSFAMIGVAGVAVLAALLVDLSTVNWGR